MATIEDLAKKMGVERENSPSNNYGNKPKANSSQNAKSDLSNENFVDRAEHVINQLGQDKRNFITTTKLRALMAINTDIYNEVLGMKEEDLGENICTKIDYLKIRCIYESGRYPAVKAFVDASDMRRNLDKAKKSRKDFLLFSKYMEAMVAFHKYYMVENNIKDE